MKKWIKIYFSILFYPVLYFPYKILNYFVISKVFGCPCEHPKFNANTITDIFWIVVGALTLFCFVRAFLKYFELKGKRNFALFIISFILIIIYSVTLTVLFGRSMYWD